MAPPPEGRTPVEDHIARVDALLAPLGERGIEMVALADALGRVPAEDVRAPIPLPPFRNSQMDGFAVRAADVAAASPEIPVALPVVGESAAAPGTPPPLAVGTALRIMTGAPVPEGADAIIPVEDTEESADATGDTVRIRQPRRPGEYVREPGSDAAAGSIVIPAGVRLASRHLAAIAAAGLAEIPMRRRVRVAVISSGSELVAPGEPLTPGRIPDANGPALAAAVTAAGAEVVLSGRVADDVAELRDLLDRAKAAGAELVLTSGGVSMGAHEVVRDLLEPLGAYVDVLAMQPGGPQATARDGDLPIVCFPGNPVSSQLSFLLFVEPLLRRLAGMPPRPRAPRTLAADLVSIPERRQFLRGRIEPDGRVTVLGGPGSHLVATYAAADVLLDIPAAVTALPAGASVETWEL